MFKLKILVPLILFLGLCFTGIAQKQEKKIKIKLKEFVENKLYYDVGLVPTSYVFDSRNDLNVIGFNADVGYKISNNLAVFCSFNPSFLLDKKRNSYSHLNNGGVGVSYAFLNMTTEKKKFKSLSTSIKGGTGDNYLPSDLFQFKEYTYYEISLKCNFHSHVYMGIGFTQRFFDNDEILNTLYPVFGFTF